MCVIIELLINKFIGGLNQKDRVNILILVTKTGVCVATVH